MKKATEQQLGHLRMLYHNGLGMTEREILRYHAERMLNKPVPSWWKQSAAAFRHCVKQNFADVLEA